MQESQDAFGHEVNDYYRDPGAGIVEIIERDDGYIGVSGGPAAYFAPFEAWPAQEQEAMEHVRGRVLDVGCGPGRVCLYLQERGHEVVGIDNSPLAVQVARQRGVRDARLLSVTQASANKLGRFDTIVMMGHNFGLFGTPRRARWLLRRFDRMTGPKGRIIATSNDIYQTDDLAHLEFHEQNRRRGRLPGQLRLRVRHKRLVGPWFDYLMVSPEEMGEILDDTSWRISRLLTSEETSSYVAIIEKRARAIG